MGFEDNYREIVSWDLVDHEHRIDKMINILPIKNKKDDGDFLYSVVRLRNGSDTMGSQFSKEFDTFLVYLLGIVFDYREFHSLYDEMFNRIHK